ncbi:MAG: DUF2510 domain-containing protein [Pseudolysinimonas sp.]|uniref:DUF2510 domain-containing protein n=1 Tax=Pseudolysinimonas sp. TaxID=2680009 RepID=UPI0032632D9C
MTYEATRVVPAGWYEDPASSAHVRWWNGLAWTEHTTLKPTAPPRPQQPVAEQRYGDGFTHQQNQQGWLSDHTDGQHATSDQGSTAPDAVDAGQAASTAARIAEARALERQYGISTEEHDVIVRSATEGSAQDASAGLYGASDATSRSRGTSNWHAEPESPEPSARRTATASSWLIALYPVLTLVAAIAAAYVAFYISPEPAVAGIPVVAGLVLVPYLLCLIWAFVDASRLKSLGHSPASGAFAILGPLVYLIARRVRVKGVGPLIALILLTLASVAVPAVAISSGATAPLAKALEVQQTIRADLVGSGRLASVSCPISVESIQPGTLYTCDGTLADGTAKTVWVSIDTSAGGFSYALAVK